MTSLERLARLLPSSFGPGLRLQAGTDDGFMRALFVTRRWEEVRAAPGWTDAQRVAFLHAQAELQQRHYALHYRAAEFLLLEHQGQPIGRLCLQVDASEVRVVDIALLPAWQGNGLGSTLLAAVLALADGQHTPCALSVEPFNPARRLYARLGFEVVGEQGLYLHMQRPLKQTCAEGTPMEP